MPKKETPIVKRLPLKALVHELRVLVKEHEIPTAIGLHPLMKKTGAFFTPEDAMKQGDPAIVIAPPRWDKTAQRKMAYMIEGFYHGMKVARLDAKEAGGAS